MDLVVLKTSNIVVELNVVFGFNMEFLNKNFDNISLNIPIFEKIFKFVKFGGIANNKALKNFIKFMIMNDEKYHLISGFNDLSAFGIGYNKHIGFIDFKTDLLGFNKGIYCKVFKNSYTKNCLMLNIKSPNVDINNRYFIVPDDMYNIVFNDEPINELFDRVMIKTFNLKIPYTKKGIPLSALLFEYEQYEQKIKINHDLYYLEDNNYLRYLVNIYFDYYSHDENSFNSFIEFLNNRGIKTYNDFKKEYIDQITIDEFIEHENTLNHGYELINLVFYLQTINFIENNLKGHDKKLRNIKELNDKKLRFNKNIILHIFKDINTNDLNKLKDFLKSL